MRRLMQCIPLLEVMVSSLCSILIWKRTDFILNTGQMKFYLQHVAHHPGATGK